MICVDSSVAVKWILQEDRSEQARSLFIATVGAGEPIVAPSLLTIEITNILRQRIRRDREFSLERALRLLRDFEQFPIDIHDPPDLHRRALALADELDLPATYDAHYLALAETLACPLWTDDRRLQSAAAGRLPGVRLIGDFSGSSA